MRFYHYEKEGGPARTQRQLQAFHDVLADCELVDMGFTSDIFTWHRGKIRERLDRGVTNAQWNTKFPNVGLVNGEIRPPSNYCGHGSAWGTKYDTSGPKKIQGEVAKGGDSE